MDYQNKLRAMLQELRDDPCWDGYVAYGTKKKNGREVPNCVKENLNESIEQSINYSKKKIEKELFSFLDKNKTKIEYRKTKYGLHVTINHYNLNRAYKSFLSNEELENKEHLDFAIEVIVGELEGALKQIKMEYKERLEKLKERLREETYDKFISVLTNNDTKTIFTKQEIDELASAIKLRKNKETEFSLAYKIITDDSFNHPMKTRFRNLFKSYF